MDKFSSFILTDYDIPVVCTIRVDLVLDAAKIYEEEMQKKRNQ